MYRGRFSLSSSDSDQRVFCFFSFFFFTSFHFFFSRVNKTRLQARFLAQFEAQERRFFSVVMFELHYILHTLFEMNKFKIRV